MIADVDPTPTLVTAMNLSGAALAGLAVGVEREWSGHASGPTGRFAGVRTFLLLGILGGLAGWAIRGALVPVAVTLLAGGAAFTIAAYVSATHRPGAALDGTTEVAALVVLALGTVSGLGNVGLACAIEACGPRCRDHRWRRRAWRSAIIWPLTDVRSSSRSTSTR
jgi:hypothetical protein